MALDKNGFYELLDPTPMAIPVGYKQPETLADQIRRMVRSERLAQEVEAAGFETWEEADDFDVDDDFDPTSPYEQNFDQDIPLPQVKHFKEEKPANKNKKEKTAGDLVKTDDAQ